ncbi:MAG: translation initiation factor IF-6 [Thermoproteota archaeon]|nr:translation initiation factor IF-6 [Thermoproteota archaeon]
MGIYKYDVYRSPNIGLFVKSNNTILSVPFGFAETKAKKLKDYLNVDNMFYASVSGTRLIGPLSVMNNNGIILPSTASEEELQLFKQESKLNVDRLKSKFTAIGNLISANDNGALVSSLIKGETHQQIRDILGVQVDTLSIAGFVQTGAMVVATNLGAAVHPNASEEEVRIISETLKVDVEPLTINGGIPYLSSGIIANSNSVVVGSLTTGPEFIMLSRAFKT